MSSIRKFLTAVFGSWGWEPPAWILTAGRGVSRAWRFLASDWRRASAATLLLLAVAGGLVWYKSRPKPHYVTYSVTAPELTEYNEKGISSIKPLQVEFSESAAPLQLVEKPVTSGIQLSPKFPGTWLWTDDKHLEFQPKNDWPVDKAFTVSFSRKFFARGVVLDEDSFDFHTKAFNAAIKDSQFYQDPRDPNLKKLVATVEFSHPVDTERFEQKVSLAVAGDAAYLGLKPDSRSFTVVYDKFKLFAYIHSAALAMPRDDTPMTLRVDKGVRAARGGNGTKSRLEAVVTIPGRSSLRFSGLQMTLVDNAKYEPEQILLVASSSPVAEQALAGKVAAYLLPVRHPQQPKEDKQPYRWTDESQIGRDLLASSQRVPLTYVSSEEGGQTSHGFKFLAPVGRWIYFEVPQGIDGIGGYISGKPFAATIQVEPYKQALTFLGNGSLLSLSGDKKLGFLARDVDHVEVEVGRLLPNQLQHLAPSMWDYSKPNVPSYMADSMVERFVEVRDYMGKQPGKPTYDSIDLGRYLRNQTQNARGLFLLRLRSVKGKNDESDGNDSDGNEGTAQDTRLILITDLGFIVKTAKDGSRDVFVQSIRTGLPVDGVRVEALGRNGMPLMAATTANGGRAQLPKFGNQLRREKTPLLFVAQTDSDFSFMPLQGSGRFLDTSRFDTGGVVNENSPQQVSAYLFSDRGIYRPGETTNVGLIARTADWKGALAGLPVEVEITDPRGAVVSRNALKLSATAFEEIAFTTQPAAPTGTYSATAFLVKNDKNREVLGSTTFKVQEFEPDRMKVQLELSPKPAEGWLRPEDVQPRATVAHLFGEAATGRRVEAEMGLTAVLPRFSRYPDHRFQVGETLTEPFHETLAATVTDEKGVAVFHPDLGRFTGRAYRLNLLVRAFEAEGGRNVAAQNTAIVSSAPFLVGVKQDGDLAYVKRNSARAANWLAVNQQLAPVAADSLSLDWVQNKFVSVLTQQNDHTYRYVSRRKEIVRDTRKVRIAAGGTNLPIPTQEPGDFTLVLRDATGAELNKLSYSVAGDANLSKSLDRDAELQVQLDKPSYAGGETIEVSIRAPYVGAGLITVERDRVFVHRWFKSTTTSTVQHIQLPNDFEGNGYVSVQFVRDPASDEIFLSPLSYGVAAFGASLAARQQPLKLTAPREVKPGAVLTMDVVPAEASRVAVLAVDEGILQVARYKNPDPLGFFFQKRMLEVQTSQILDLILPEFQRFLALAAPGGDAAGGFARHLNPFARKHKAPVAYWSGIVDVGPQGHRFHYTVPDYFNGKLRIVAIAVSPRRVGTAEAGTEVKGPFILTPNVPAMVAPGDEFTVSVGVFNNTSGNASVHIEAQPAASLTPVSASAADLQIASKREAAGEFRFRAGTALGAASVKFVARGGGNESHIEESISVRPAVAYRTQLTLGRFDSATTQAPLTRDMYPENRKVQAAVSTVPLVWGQGLVKWLDDYPYLCTEQLVSKGIGALLIASRPEFGTLRTRAGSAAAQQNTLDVLQSRQNETGGFGLWASSPETAEFPSAYAAQYLLEAKERGQKVPAALVASVNEWLMRYASTPAPTLADGRWRAYAVYLLARQGIKPGNALANVEQELANRYAQTWQTDIAAAWVAATYRLMQRNADAERIIAKVPFSRQKHDAAADLYYDPVVHDAQLVYVLAHQFPTRLSSVPATALEDMAAAASRNQLDSLSAAWTLLALDAYAKTASMSGKLSIAEIGKDGRERSLTATAGVMPRAELSVNAAKVNFGKEGAVAAYYSIDESGFDRNAPAAGSQGIEIIHEFLDVKGNPVSRVKVGEEFFVRIRLRSVKQPFVPQIAVVDLLPGGTEPVLELRPAADSATPSEDPAAARQNGHIAALPIGVPGKCTWTPQHVDVRDDRIVLYGDVGKDAVAFVYRARATNAGIFQSPPAFAEGLYDPKTTGISAAGRLEVVKP